ncbi:MAG: hypothetical protein QG590_1966 [Pseudomonadota bacterium]|nr:hypothetical protein [Pseudomonadota bacterium]
MPTQTGDTLKAHSLAGLFPLMHGREFDELVADIRANGLREPITILDGMILDGRNRWRACEAAGVIPTFAVYDGDDPLAWVISLNLHRRHLDESQRGIVAAKIANLSDGQRADRSANLPTSPVTQADAAALLNVSERTVRSARRVVESGAPELLEAVESGQVSVSAAADVAELPKAEQAEIVARGEREILEAARKIRSEKAEVRREERIQKLVEMADPAPDLQTAQRYPVIYADPPWRYDYSESTSRDIENHYPTMELDAICALPVSDLATDDAVLFLWATSPKLADAMRVVGSWGFTYRTCAVWHKPQIGMGYYFRQQHELLLVATRGSIPAPAPADRPGSVITASRGAHSEKPAEFAELIERMYPALPKIELFCRSPRSGWAVWGNQAA